SRHRLDHLVVAHRNLRCQYFDGISQDHLPIFVGHHDIASCCQFAFPLPNVWPQRLSQKYAQMNPPHDIGDEIGRLKWQIALLILKTDTSVVFAAPFLDLLKGFESSRTKLLLLIKEKADLLTRKQGREKPL